MHIRACIKTGKNTRDGVDILNSSTLSVIGVVASAAVKAIAGLQKLLAVVATPKCRRQTSFNVHGQSMNRHT